MKCPMCGADTLDDLVVKGEMTNEEYLKSCNTEQLAEFMNTIINRCYECGGDARVYCCPFGDCECNVVEWLKQPHTDKE